MQKYLITGVNGQLGSDLRELAKNSSDQFLFTDVDDLDITDTEAVRDAFRLFGPDVLINCASYTAVDKAESDSAAAYLINGDAPGILADVCNSFSTLLIHISTDYVFDGKSNIPYKETDAVNPSGVYAKSKLQGENAVISTSEKAAIFRTSWLYSSFGLNFVKTILRLGKERTELNVVFDQTGSPTYARDLAAAILNAAPVLMSRKLEGTEIYNYSNEGVASWYDFAMEIKNIVGFSANINPIETFEYPTPAPRPVYSVLNKRKVKTEFGFTIPHWKDSLKKALKLC
ncbi:MAG: dTDP-4-dehydrorhamnose reductase [Bacteroidetes bacterium]|nr:dTDP-4-dehydrorhamnose reductase [Bacteroidota bacterium]MBU1719934.1 dTDP-4-dehydrorhamnose reductase [Bacteroidota bacterium]